MTVEEQKKVRRKAKSLYVNADPKRTFKSIADELNVSLSAIFSWQKADIEKGSDKWEDIRKRNAEKKLVTQEKREIRQEARKELTQLFDREEARKSSMELLVRLREKLSDEKLLDKITNVAKVEDVIKVLNRISKEIEGLGFADKVIVVGAPKPDEDILETEFEILED